MAELRRDPKQAWKPWQPSTSQPWDLRRAAHLLRRAEFGTPIRELEVCVKAGYSKTVDRVFSVAPSVAFDQSMQSMEKALSSSQDPRQLAVWWLLRMVQTPCQLLEKTTLFWHGHFATSADKVLNSRAMLRQIEWLRAHALGHFEPMVQGISQDVAMLIYLDSEENRKTRPNENYARELMELFCLGPGNYSEKDIKELARCFTGWEIRRGNFRFNQHQHDHAEKILLGQRGNFTGEQAIHVVLDQPSTAGFIARKLVRFFVLDDRELSDELIQPLADQLRENDFDIRDTLKTILTSQLFFADDTIGQKVKSPVEMAVGLLRALGVQADLNQLSDQLLALGHLPLYPPNVKGWGGGREWINASTFLGRANLVYKIANQENSQFSRGSISKAVNALPKMDPEIWIRKLVEAYVAVPLPGDTMHQLIELGSAKRRNLNQRVADVVCAIGATPEYQLN
ncbi:MAG: DUF1800 domain-containing protein [Pirellulaceae bacterium]|nr:DUF1800 domain-containing protein [Pirellulaceae bacterium]